MADDRKRTVGELMRGRKITNQLREMLKKDPRGKGAEDLVVRILGTFDKTIGILNSIDTDEVSQGVADPGSPFCDGRRSEDDSSGSCKTFVKDRRGCYKRRKTCEKQIKESPNLVDDGHAWRKYGQKVILHAKFPRNYFRCTHKLDQNCQATKQVQQIGEEPALYRTTYLGKHTCMNFQKCPQIILHPTQPDDSSILLCFGQNSQSDNYPSLPTLSSSVKHENPGSHVGSPISGSFLPSDDRLGSPYDASGHFAPLSSVSDYGDNMSSGGTMDMYGIIGADVDVDEYLRVPFEF